jgi:1,4-alpha-glucan branching enzyme
MGDEIGQWQEWDHEKSLDWHLLQYPAHSGLQRLVQDAARLYRGEPALYELDFDPGGFEWVDCNDSLHSVVSYLRRGRSTVDNFLIVLNFTPVPHSAYRVGVPRGGHWKEVLNSDAETYGGSGQGNLGGVEAVPSAFHGRPFSLAITLPPLAAVVFKSSIGEQVISETG